MFIAGTQWMGVRVDFLSALFVGLVAITSIITSQDAGNTNSFGILCLRLVFIWTGLESGVHILTRTL